MERADLCRECGGKCCTTPFFTNEEYIRLVKVIGNERAQQFQPERCQVGWRFKVEVCPALTDHGCILPYDERPALCKWYPFIPIRTFDGEITLLLAVRTCPAWKEFGERYQEVLDEVKREVGGR